MKRIVSYLFGVFSAVLLIACSDNSGVIPVDFTVGMEHCELNGRNVALPAIPWHAIGLNSDSLLAGLGQEGISEVNYVLLHDSLLMKLPRKQYWLDPQSFSWVLLGNSARDSLVPNRWFDQKFILRGRSFLVSGSDIWARTDSAWLPLDVGCKPKGSEFSGYPGWKNFVLADSTLAFFCDGYDGYAILEPRSLSWSQHEWILPRATSGDLWAIGSKWIWMDWRDGVNGSDTLGGAWKPLDCSRNVSLSYKNFNDVGRGYYVGGSRANSTALWESTVVHAEQGTSFDFSVPGVGGECLLNYLGHWQGRLLFTCYRDGMNPIWGLEDAALSKALDEAYPYR